MPKYSVDGLIQFIKSAMEVLIDTLCAVLELFNDETRVRMKNLDGSAGLTYVEGE